MHGRRRRRDERATTHSASHLVPLSWDERVRLTTIDTTIDNDDAVTPGVDGVPLWAVREAIDGCDCYALAKRNQG